MEAEIQLPLGRDLRRRNADTTQRVAAPDRILRIVKPAGSMAPPARAILQSTELEAKATRVIAERAIVTEADRSVRFASRERPAGVGT
jgi:hypothetical protein